MTQRRMTRRSFLARVAGGSLIIGGPMGLIAGTALAGQATDHDPTEPAGHGRGGHGAPRGAGPAPGVTDRDYGPTADPPQRGRGSQLHARNARECRDIRNRLTHVEAQLSRVAPRLREMEATYNFIAGDSQDGGRPDLYVDRVRRFGIDVPYGSSADQVMQGLGEEIGRARIPVDPLEQEAAGLRQALVNRNYG
jgi:hypothetical protein